MEVGPGLPCCPREHTLPPPPAWWVPALPQTPAVALRAHWVTLGHGWHLCRMVTGSPASLGCGWRCVTVTAPAGDCCYAQANTAAPSGQLIVPTAVFPGDRGPSPWTTGESQDTVGPRGPHLRPTPWPQNSPGLVPRTRERGRSLRPRVSGQVHTEGSGGQGRGNLSFMHHSANLRRRCCRTAVLLWAPGPAASALPGGCYKCGFLPPQSPLGGGPGDLCFRWPHAC